MTAQIGKPMCRPIPMLLIAAMQKGAGIVENKACAADQMPCAGIIDRAIIKKMVEKSPFVIAGVRRIEIQNAGNVIPQKCRAREVRITRAVRIGGHSMMPSQRGRCASMVSRHDVTIWLCAKSGRSPAAIEAMTSSTITAY